MLWRLLAAISVGLGVIGAVLPVLPTVPFLLLAAWAASRGWPELETRLLAHPTYGPYITNWREQGAIPRRAKWLASAMMRHHAVVQPDAGVGARQRVCDVDGGRRLDVDAPRTGGAPPAARPSLSDQAASSAG